MALPGRGAFVDDLAQVPEGVNVHVMPTGLGERRPTTWSNLRYRDRRRIGDRADVAYQASLDYIRELGRSA